MKPILIILPGRHGDIILTLPIAKYYSDRGRDVHWVLPNWPTYRSIARAIDYVKWMFFGETAEEAFRYSYEAAATEAYEVMDLSMGQSQSRLSELRNDQSFVLTRYQAAGVPIAERSKLVWNRDLDLEDQLYKEIVGDSNEPYTLVHRQTWVGELDLGRSRYREIEVCETQGYSVLDWYKIICNASELRMLDSVFSNLVEALPECRHIEKHVWLRGSPASNSLFFGNWTVHQDHLAHKGMELPARGEKTESLHFPWPNELVCAGPTPLRDQARLLVIYKKMRSIYEHSAHDLPGLLRDRDVWLNKARVPRTRFRVWRDSGHRQEVQLVEQLDRRKWIALLIGPRVLAMDPSRTWFTEHGVHRIKWGREIKPGYFEFTFLEEVDLEKIGTLPNTTASRRPESKDEESWFESVYATETGGSAVPTAGVHLREEDLAAMRTRYLALFCNLENSRRVRTPFIHQHAAHFLPEPYQFFDLPERPGVAVGTSSCRALEAFGEDGRSKGHAHRFYYPPYKFVMTNGLLTNLHTPASPETALVKAFINDDRLWRQVHSLARRAKYRWGAYGDQLLVLDE